MALSDIQEKELRLQEDKELLCWELRVKVLEKDLSATKRLWEEKTEAKRKRGEGPKFLGLPQSQGFNPLYRHALPYRPPQHPSSGSPYRPPQHPSSGSPYRPPQHPSSGSPRCPTDELPKNGLKPSAISSGLASDSTNRFGKLPTSTTSLATSSATSLATSSATSLATSSATSFTNDLEIEKRVRKSEDDELERLRLVRADAGRALKALKKQFNKKKKKLSQNGVKFSLKGEIDLLSVPGGVVEAKRVAAEFRALKSSADDDKGLMDAKERWKVQKRAMEARRANCKMKDHFPPEEPQPMWWKMHEEEDDYYVEGEGDAEHAFE